MAYTITVNGTRHEVDVEGDTPLLWVLRDTLGLTGTKFGCGISMCGACTVMMDGFATRACVYPIEAADGMEITTIEGLSENADHPVQKAWIAEQVPQCGYCQSGMIMTAVSMLNDLGGKPSDEDIDAMVTNICRCGTYQRVRKAIHRAAEEMYG